jgi:hypothetical protein
MATDQISTLSTTLHNKRVLDGLTNLPQEIIDVAKRKSIWQDPSVGSRVFFEKEFILIHSSQRNNL